MQNYCTLFRLYTENGITSDARSKETLKKRARKFGIKYYQIHELRISEGGRRCELQKIHIYKED